MTQIRKLFFATVLTIVISITGVAGDMWTTGIGNPPPPPGGGRVATSDVNGEVKALDTLTETAMFLYKSMLSLF
jgi:hypothetical protein